MRMAACGQTMAHLPQSMQMASSQMGISWAMARFSHLVVAVVKRAVDREGTDRQQVALAGHDPGGDVLDEVGRLVGDDGGELDRRPEPAPVSTLCSRSSERSMAA